MTSNDEYPPREEGAPVQLDRFLEHPPKQPKAEIADMLEARGIRVAPRAKTLDEAKALVREGKRIILRSEHPDEYAGPSGVFDSIVIEPSGITLQEGLPDLVKARMEIQESFQDVTEESLPGLFKQASNTERVERYTRIVERDKDDYLAELSYSYWEMVPGANVTITADNALKGRYHITVQSDSFSRGTGYFIYDNHEVTAHGGVDVEGQVSKYLLDVVSMYELIRNTEGFDPNHCPLIEIQVDEDGEPYFLQTHRGVDFKERQFILDRPPEEGEVEVEFVKGATPPEGIIVDVGGDRGPWESISDITEQAEIVPASYSAISIEATIRKQQVQLIQSGLSKVGADLLKEGHHAKTPLLKSGITVVFGGGENFRKIIPLSTEDAMVIYKKINDYLLYDPTVDDIKPEVPPPIAAIMAKYTTPKIKVVSDGLKAYVSVVSGVGIDAGEIQELENFANKFL